MLSKRLTQKLKRGAEAVFRGLVGLSGEAFPVCVTFSFDAGHDHNAKLTVERRFYHGYRLVLETRHEDGVLRLAATSRDGADFDSWLKYVDL